MARTPEGKVKARIKALLKKYRVWYCMPQTGGYGKSGVPDFICCVGGRFWGVEAKANGGKATALQLLELDAIRLAGGVALVIDETNIDKLEAYLQMANTNAATA